MRRADCDSALFWFGVRVSVFKGVVGILTGVGGGFALIDWGGLAETLRGGRGDLLFFNRWESVVMTILIEFL